MFIIDDVDSFWIQFQNVANSCECRCVFIGQVFTRKSIDRFMNGTITTFVFDPEICFPLNERFQTIEITFGQSTMTRSKFNRNARLKKSFSPIDSYVRPR